MALLQAPSYGGAKYYDFNVESPGQGGVNLDDLEYDLDSNQSPKMLNMMIRDGSLSKRYR